MSLSQNLYDDAAKLGSFQAKIGLVIGGLIAVCLSVAAIYLFFKDDSNWIQVKATVTSSNCSNPENCIIGVRYSDKTGTSYDGILNTGKTPYNVGAQIDIDYDSKNPHAITNFTFSNKETGTALCCFACCVVIIVVFSYYMTSRFKFFAAAQGTSTAVSLISAPFGK